MEVLFLLVMVAFSIAIIIFGNRIKNKTKLKEKYCTLKTTGEVVEFIKEFRKDRHERGSYYLYFPVIKYNINGLEFIKKIDFGMSTPMCAVGNYVEVYVNPNDFEDVYIKEQLGIKGVANCLIIFGILVLVFVLVLTGIIIFSNVVIKIFINEFSVL